MKQRRMLQVLVVSLMLIWGASRASALGLGAYYSLGTGDGTVEYDDDYDDLDIDNDYRTRFIGFVLDTNVAKDSVFNYRLNIGLDKIESESENGGKVKADGYVMDHTFGFGVLRNRYVRLWVGPQISLSYYQDDASSHNYYNDDDFNMFGLGFGPAVGVNIHAGDKVSFTLTSGYKYAFIFGSDYGDDYTGTAGQFYMNFGVLFRINDVY